MLDHPHRAITLRLWDAIAGSDIAALHALLAPKAVWRIYGRSPLAGTYNGVEAIMAFLARVGELSDDLNAELMDVFVSDRGAVVRYAVEARRGRRRLEGERLLMIRIEDGVVVESIFVPLDQERYDRFWQDA